MYCPLPPDGREADGLCLAIELMFMIGSETVVPAAGPPGHAHVSHRGPSCTIAIHADAENADDRRNPGLSDRPTISHILTVRALGPPGLTFMLKDQEYSLVKKDAIEIEGKL